MLETRNEQLSTLTHCKVDATPEHSLVSNLAIMIERESSFIVANDISTILLTSLLLIDSTCKRGW